jgi:beta-galactosidase
MHRRVLPLLLLFLLSGYDASGKSFQNNSASLSHDAQMRVEQAFNLGWSFMRATKDGLEVPKESAAWRSVNLPYDYSLEARFIPPAPPKGKGKKGKGKVGDKAKDKELSVGALGLHLGNRSTGYLPGGPAWYKKHFAAPENFADKKVQILFDGVYMYSDVWINGKHLGHRHYGYSAFYYDLTPYLKPGDENILLVRTDNKLQSRWYSGSGIYRPVTLIVTDKVNIPVWGTTVTTPKISKAEAEVVIETKVRNDGKKPRKVVLTSTVQRLDQTLNSGVSESKSVPAGGEAVFSQTIKVANPVLWSVEMPNLYRVVSKVEVDGRVVDDNITSFGIRSLRFDPDEGFLLNGKYTKLKGVCIHADNGLLGSESYAWAEERKILALKDMGCNAVRCAHNPPSAAFLDACDRLGMLVIDEAFDEWKKGKAKGYSPVFNKYWKIDLDSMIFRDRNHPSVIMWSIGNEVPDQGRPEGPKLAKMLAERVRQLDPTRPVTHGVQPGAAPWGGKFPPPEFFEPIDVCGYNYQNLSRNKGGDFIENHKEFPKRIMYQSESMGTRFFEDWMVISDNKYILGDFVWTGIDYLGEVGCGRDRGDQKSYPAYMAMCGDLDITCGRKPRSYYRQLLWDRKPTVFATVRPISTGWKRDRWGWTPSISTWSWDHKPGTTVPVDVYSGCEEAELFLNGKSLGKQPTSRETKFMASWEVPYQEGELKVVGINGGKPVTEYVLKSSGKPTALKLTADRKSISADGCDIVYLTLEVVGENGICNTEGIHEIQFKVDGPGQIAGVGSSSPYAPVKHPFHGNTCETWRGRATLIIRSTSDAGTITVKANAEGLESESIKIQTTL